MRTPIVLLIAALAADVAAQSPRQLAEEVAAAQTDAQRERAIGAVLRAVNVGVYTAQGAAVSGGAERGCVDFYVYDFEVSFLARALAVEPAQRWTLANLAQSLANMGVRHDRLLLTPAQLQKAIEAAGNESPAVAVASELAAIRGAGLTELDPLQRFLILLDAGLTLQGRATLPTVDPALLLLKNSAATQSGNVCAGAGASGNRQPWKVGGLMKSLRADVPKLSPADKDAAAGPVVDELHVVLTGYSLRALSLTPDVGVIHYGHGAPVAPTEFRVLVEAVAEPLERTVRAGWLAGVEFAALGPVEGVKVDWQTGGLGAHGTIECPEKACRLSGADGVAVLKFTPRQEENPEVGRLVREAGITTSFVNSESQTSFVMGRAGSQGAANEGAPSVGAAMKWVIEYHNPAGQWVGTIEVVESGSLTENHPSSATVKVSGARVSSIRLAHSLRLRDGIEVDLGDSWVGVFESVAASEGKQQITDNYLGLDTTRCQKPDITKAYTSNIMAGSGSGTPPVSIEVDKLGRYKIEFNVPYVALVGHTDVATMFKGGCNPFGDADNSRRDLATKMHEGRIYSLFGQIDPARPDEIASSQDFSFAAIPQSRENRDGIPTTFIAKWNLRRVK